MLTIDHSGWDALTRWADQRTQSSWPAHAHAEAAHVVSAVWQAALTGTVFPPMTQPVHRPDVADTVTVHATESGATIQADPQALASATGERPPRDLKPALLHGPKSRVGKTTGLRYNIIPFRHRAETVPTAVMTSLVQTGTFQGLLGQRSKILAGGRDILAFHAASGILQVVSHYTWRTGLYAGMRMGATGPVTFRTVSERSPAGSWWIPARPGIPLLEAVWRAAQDDVQWVYVVAWWEGLFS